MTTIEIEVTSERINSKALLEELQAIQGVERVGFLEVENVAVWEGDEERSEKRPARVVIVTDDPTVEKAVQRAVSGHAPDKTDEEEARDRGAAEQRSKLETLRSELIHFLLNDKELLDQLKEKLLGP